MCLDELNLDKSYLNNNLNKPGGEKDIYKTEM